jgi:hypothetical protein
VPGPSPTVGFRVGYRLAIGPVLSIQGVGRIHQAVPELPGVVPQASHTLCNREQPGGVGELVVRVPDPEVRTQIALAQTRARNVDRTRRLPEDTADPTYLRRIDPGLMCHADLPPGRTHPHGVRFPEPFGESTRGVNMSENSDVRVPKTGRGHHSGDLIP